MIDIIFASPCDDRGTTHTFLVYSMPHTIARLTFASLISIPRVIHPPFGWTRSLRTSGSKLNLCRLMVRTAAKKTLNSRGESMHPCCNPYSISNHPVHSPLSDCIHTLIPSWTCRMTAIISGRTPMRTNTGHKRALSAMPYAF